MYINVNGGGVMKLNDIEIKKVKIRLIISSILALSIGVVSGLTNNLIGIIPCVFFLAITSFYFMIGVQQISYTKSMRQLKQNQKL